MDSLEVNKAIASILVAGIAFMVSGFIGDILVAPHALKKPAIEIAGAPAETASAAQPQTPKAPPIVPLLASADVAKGKQLVETDCTICHTFNKGGQPKVGPNLYGIVGDPRAHEKGFDYTEGLQKLGGKWTYPHLDQWLYDPHTVVPGTRMAFSGIKNTKERADVIAYLRTLSPHPVPLPSPQEVKAAEQEAAQAKAGTMKAAATPPAAAQQATTKAGPPHPTFVSLVAKANPAKGKEIAETVCGICHSFKKGAPPKIGPNLWGIVGDPRAHEAGFDYSTGLKKLGGTWTYDALNHWLTDPRGVVPDTRMMFPGFKSEKERAEVVAFLRTLSDHPAPLPKAGAAAAPPAAPAAKPTQAAATPGPAAPAQPATQPAAPAPKPAAAAPSAASAAKPAPSQAATQPAAPQPASFVALVAHADPAKGKQDVETFCAICHSFEKGQPPKIGPNLYGIVGAPRAHEAGFDYTAGLKKLGGTWTYANLNQWLTNPMAVVPGTRMMFPGVKSEKQRANIVAYLRTLSEHPEPLPTPAAAAPSPAPAPSANNPSAKKELVTPAPVTTRGTEVAPAAGGTRQENPAEQASPAGAGLPAQQPQGGVVGAPTPARKQP